MSGSSGRPTPGPHVLVLRAAFVPDGEPPPPEFLGVFHPLKFPATYDPATGQISCINAGVGFHAGIPAEWHPDTNQGFGDQDEAPGQEGEATGQADDAVGRDGGNPAEAPPRQAAATAAGAKRQDDRPEAVIPPTGPRGGAASTWPGYGGDATRSTWPFGQYARAAGRTAAYAGAAAGVAGHANEGTSTVPAPFDPGQPGGFAAASTDQAALSGEIPYGTTGAIGGPGTSRADGSVSEAKVLRPTASATLKGSGSSQSAIAAAGITPVSYLQSTTPVPFQDDKGKPVLSKDGKPMLMPSDADPHFFVDAAPVFGLAGLYNFRQGGPWDLQRVGQDRKYIGGFVDFSTVAIGLYGAAAGIPLDTLLRIQDQYAARHSSFGSAKMDAEFTHLREDNVWNTRLGYELFSSGRVGPSATGAAIFKNPPPQ